jgi:hypothetical protein
MPAANSERFRITWADAPFLVLLLLGTLLRVGAIFAYRPIFLLVGDSYTYLRQARGAGVGSSWHPGLYGLAMRPIVALHNLTVLAVVQHVLGIAIAVAIYALLRIRLRVPAVLAALAAAPALLEGFQINLEHHVLAEAMFETFIVAALVLLVWPRTPRIVTPALAGVLLAAAATTRYAGFALLPVALVYVLVRRRSLIPALALIVGIVLPLVAYSGWQKTQAGSFGVTQRNGFFLYGRVASFVQCSKFHYPRSERSLCISVPPAERDRGGVWGAFSPIEALRGQGSIDHQNHLAQDFAIRAIEAQPLDYLHAVGNDMAEFLSPEEPMAKEPPGVSRWTFPEDLSQVQLGGKPVRRWKGSPPPRWHFHERFTIDRGIAKYLRTYQEIVYMRGPILGAFLALGLLGGLIRGGLGSRGDLRLESLLFSVSAVALMLFSVVVTVYHYRYTIPLVLLSGPSVALGLSQLADLTIRRWRRREMAGSPATDRPADHRQVRTEDAL